MPFRVGGIQGAVYLQGELTKLADSYMWEYEEVQEVLDASIKGESFKRYVADVGTGTVRMQSFIPKPADRTPLTYRMHQTNVFGVGVGTAIDFILHMIDGHTTIIGQGYITRSRLHVVRDGIVTDELEIQVDGRPTTVN